FGSTVGRYANRIAGGSFTLDGRTYNLPLNDAPGSRPCSLHGGNTGFDRMLWSEELPRQREGRKEVAVRYLSPDGEEGYPGNRLARVAYSLTEDNGLRIAFSAAADRPTLVNLTNHTYWNLTGDPRCDVLGHRLRIDAARYLPVDAGLIPLGQFED